MDSFTYNNIFETKGIEYIIIIIFLLSIIPFWLLMNRKLPVVEKLRKRIGSLTASALRMPEGIFFSKNHTWAFMEKSGSAKVGLDDLLLKITGEISVKPLVDAGKVIRRGEPIASLTSGERHLIVLSPVSGEVMQLNSALAAEPGLVNSDPYSEGWILTLKPSAWITEITYCHLAGDAVEWSKRELGRFRDFIAGISAKYSPEAIPIILQDGGEMSDEPLSGMPEEVWNEFEKSFMKLAD